MSHIVDAQFLVRLIDPPDAMFLQQATGDILKTFARAIEGKPLNKIGAMAGKYTQNQNKCQYELLFKVNADKNEEDEKQVYTSLLPDDTINEDVTYGRAPRPSIIKT